MQSLLIIAAAATALYFLAPKKGKKKAPSSTPAAGGVEDADAPIDLDECLAEISAAIEKLTDSTKQAEKDKLHLMADVKQKQVDLLLLWKAQFEKKGFDKAALCAQRVADLIAGLHADKVG